MSRSESVQKRETHVQLHLDGCESSMLEPLKEWEMKRCKRGMEVSMLKVGRSCANFDPSLAVDAKIIKLLANSAPHVILAPLGANLRQTERNGTRVGTGSTSMRTQARCSSRACTQNEPPISSAAQSHAGVAESVSCVATSHSQNAAQQCVPTSGRR